MIKKLSSKTVYENPWMTVREDNVEFKNGHQGIYGVVDKPDFALIAPFDGEYLHFVKQFRYPIGRDSIEFPQGSHPSDRSVTPVEVANLELEEEIGLKANKVEKVGFLYEACGYSSQGFYVFLATDLYEGEKKPDPTEADLVHIKMTISEFESMISDGAITDAPTISAYVSLIVKNLIKRNSL